MLNYLALDKAFTMLEIALPLMFLVIGVMILATVALRRAFPAAAGEEADTAADRGGRHE